jgi:hypothetical protein
MGDYTVEVKHLKQTNTKIERLQINRRNETVSQ